MAAAVDEPVAASLVGQGSDSALPPLVALGGRLRSLRRHSGRTLGNVASSLGLSEAYLSRLEQGERIPSLPVLIHLAQEFGLTASALLETAAAEPEVIYHDARANWEGGEVTGGGYIGIAGSGPQPFSLASRIGQGDRIAGDSSPEQHIGLALASCFSMSYAVELQSAGHRLGLVETVATVALSRGLTLTEISSIHLDCSVAIEGALTRDFHVIAAKTARNCVVARALAVAISVDITAEKFGRRLTNN